MFFDELGPPWPKHPCTDNGGAPLRPLATTNGSAPSTGWARAGWHPVTITSSGIPRDGWREVSLTRIGTDQVSRFLIDHRCTPSRHSPMLFRDPADNGVGLLSWIESNGAGEMTGQESPLVSPTLEVVPRQVLDAALRGEAVAVAEAAVLLCTAARAAAGEGWNADLPSEHARLVRHWLERSAESGSSFASGCLERISAAEAAFAGSNPASKHSTSIALPDDPRIAIDTGPYKVFTRRFDEEVGALDLVTPEVMAQLSQFFDKVFPKDDLARDTTSQNPPPDLSGTLVTMLLDNSGSLRGKPIHILATTVRALADVLSQAGAKIEILGFTTRGWKGGRSHELWLSQGSPKRPGRLADLRHIVYHPSEKVWGTESWRTLSLMFEEGILKENIDGEALTWAYRRSLQTPASRRFLIVFSDGEPVDDSTISQNNSDYLACHLKDVADAIQEHGLVSLYAVGLKHDPSPYYQHSVILSGDGEREWLNQVIALLRIS